MACIRDVFESFQKHLPKYFKPFDCVTIDEQLVPFRGRCCLLQYMPSKPARYGLKYFLMACSRTNFTLATLPYLGKEGNERARNLSHDAALKLIAPCEKTGRKFEISNWSSFAKGNAIVGTERSNRRELPTQAVKINKPVGSPVFRYQKNATLVSLLNKKKNVSNLTTQACY